MFNIQIETNAILQRDQVDQAIQKKVPEGAIYFEGIVSSGDKNRNGYTIESDAWFFDNGKYVKDFLKNGSVLYGHNSDQPIGRPLSFEMVEGGKIKASGYVYDDTYTNGNIGRGLILGLSTGHITHEMVYEKDGKRYTPDEYWDLPMSEIFSNGWERIVTKAEIVEFSFVTTPSNRASVLTNSTESKIEEYAKAKNLDPNEVRLSLKNSVMNKKTTEVAPEAIETVATNETAQETTEETTEATDSTPAGETATEGNSVVEGNAVEVETLKTKMAEMEANHAKVISEMEANHAKAIAEMEANVTARIESATEAVRVTERDALAKVVGANAAGSDVKTPEDFKNKHSR